MQSNLSRDTAVGAVGSAAPTRWQPVRLGSSRSLVEESLSTTPACPRPGIYWINWIYQC